MKKIKLKHSPVFYLAISVFSFIVYLYAEFVLNGRVSGLIRLFMLLIGCCFLALYSIKKHNIITKKTYLCFFILYTAFLLNLTLFDSLYGRHISALPFKPIYEIKTYLQMHTNLIPFKTLMLYINGYANEYVDFTIVLTNLLGNVIAFMPFGFFLPMFFRKCVKPLTFLSSISLIVLGVEICQLIFMCGSFDVDDFILNVAGSFSAFLICKKYIFKELHI